MRSKYAALGIVLLMMAAAGSYSASTGDDSAGVLTGFTTADPTSGSQGKISDVALTIDFGSGSEQVSEFITADEGMNALEVLKNNHDIEGQEYAGMGYFITGIDGVTQDSEHSWLFFVDGTPAQASADNVIVEEGMEIKFMYLSNDDAMGYF